MQCLKNPSVYPPSPSRCFLLHFSFELLFSLVCAGWTSHIFPLSSSTLGSSSSSNSSFLIGFYFLSVFFSSLTRHSGSEEEVPRGFFLWLHRHQHPAKDFSASWYRFGSFLIQPRSALSAGEWARCVFYITKPAVFVPGKTKQMKTDVGESYSEGGQQHGPKPFGCGSLAFVLWRNDPCSFSNTNNSDKEPVGPWSLIYTKITLLQRRLKICSDVDACQVSSAGRDIKFLSHVCLLLII